MEADAWEMEHDLDHLDDGSTDPINGATGDPDDDGDVKDLEARELIAAQAKRLQVRQEVGTIEIFDATVHPEPALLEAPEEAAEEHRHEEEDGRCGR